MAQNFEFLDSITRTFKEEKICKDIYSLNKNIQNNDKLILYLNIRSLNSNFSSLEIFVESLTSKPFYIACVETRSIQNAHFF